MSKIVSLSKRRGFVFPSSEIYGGFSSCYDYGPLGTELKNNIKKAWWEEMIQKQENIVGLDAAILMSPKVWRASGHLSAGFADELVECKKCHKRFRQDEIINSDSRTPNSKSKIQKINCPECGGQLTEAKKFNLMMKTFVGPVENEAAITYLRAETCQGIYLNFKNVLESTRKKIPFGICQIGKSFRNEITPGNFVYRVREFEQMEMQWFCHPKTADKFFDYWKKERMKWYLNLGVKKENLRFKETSKSELPHYAKKAVDIEYKFPFGSSSGDSAKGVWREIEGIHNRGDWDLSNHSKNSGQDLKYFSEETRQKYFPHIIETSAGVDRSFLVFLIDAYQEIKGGREKIKNKEPKIKNKHEKEVLLKFHQKIAPIKVAVFPLVRNKPELVKKSKEVYKLLKRDFVCQYDELGSIGRRYRRGDEIGTIFAITVDFESLKKNDVTVRNRDSMKQKRVKINDLTEILKRGLAA